MKEYKYLKIQDHNESVLSTRPDTKYDSGLLVARNESNGGTYSIYEGTRQDIVNNIVRLVANGARLHEIIFPDKKTRIFFDVEKYFNTCDEMVEAQKSFLAVFDVAIFRAMNVLYDTRDKANDFVNCDLQYVVLNSSRQQDSDKIINTISTSYANILNNKNSKESPSEIISTSAYKLSLHIVITNIYMIDIFAVKQFASWFVQTHITVEDPSLLSWFDMSVYRQYGSLRVAGTRKTDYHGAIVVMTDGKHETVDLLRMSLIQLLDLANMFPLLHNLFESSRGEQASPTILFKQEGGADLFAIVDKYIQLSGQFRIRVLNDNVMILDRCMCGFCQLCGRHHENENAYITFHKNTSDHLRAVYKCFRDSTKTITIDIPIKQIPSNIIDRTFAHSVPANKRELKDPIGDLVANQDHLAAADRFLYGLHECMHSRMIKDNSEYIVPFPLEWKTLYVRGGMGCGKTEQLINFLSAKLATNPSLVIVVVSFRRTYSAKMFNDLKRLEFCLYYNVEHTITESRVIIQAESFMRLAHQSNCIDILVLDEIKSIFNQITGPRNTEMFLQSFSRLHRAIVAADTLICMDAYLDTTTLNCIGSVRDSKKSFLIHNTYPIEHRRVYVLAKDMDSLLWRIEQSVKENKKIAIASYSIKYSESLRELLLRMGVDKKKIMIYNSRMPTHKKRKHFRDVDTSWAKYQVVIYTSTIKAGISCTLPFDDVFGVFACVSEIRMTAEDYIQMLGRIRNCNRVTVYIAPSTGFYNLDPAFIRNTIYASMRCHIYLNIERKSNNQLCLYKTDLAMYIYIAFKQCLLYSYENFVRRFAMLFKQYGASLESLTGKSGTALNARSICDENQHYDLLRAREIAEADDITIEQYDVIKGKIKNSIEVTKQELNEVKRFEFRRIFNYYFKKVSVELIVTHYKPHMIKRFITLNLLFSMPCFGDGRELSGIRQLLRLITDPVTGALKFVNFVSNGTVLLYMYNILLCLGFRGWFDNMIMYREHVMGVTEKNKERLTKLINSIGTETRSSRVRSPFTSQRLLRVINQTFENMLGIKLVHEKSVAITWPTLDFAFTLDPDIVDSCPNWVLQHLISIFTERDVLSLGECPQSLYPPKPVIVIKKNIIDQVIRERENYTSIS